LFVTDISWGFSPADVPFLHYMSTLLTYILNAVKWLMAELLKTIAGASQKTGSIELVWLNCYST